LKKHQLKTERNVLEDFNVRHHYSTLLLLETADELL